MSYQGRRSGFVTFLKVMGDGRIRDQISDVRSAHHWGALGSAGVHRVGAAYCGPE